MYTITDQNKVAAVDLSSTYIDNFGHLTFVSAIGAVTRDASNGPIRRIRGLAYNAAANIIYGLTREGDLVKVIPSNAQTTLLHSLPAVVQPFWSGLAFNESTNKLYTANAFGNHELAEIVLSPGGMSVVSSSFVGSTTFNGFGLQILGLDYYPSSAPAIPPTFNGTHPTTGVLYGGNRNNDNIVTLSATNGAVAFTFGNQTMGVNNVQEIAFHPATGRLYAIHDHYSQSNNAAISIYDFTAQSATQLAQLPFGIVEIVGGGNDTYGWGGLTFAPAACFCLGDVNNDGKVDALDIAAWARCVVNTPNPGDNCPCADANQDGTVNLADKAPFTTLVMSPHPC